MPAFTRTAIKRSFWKLLAIKPLSKITVRDIVDDCGINRNSFYYHFADVPSLINETMRERFDEITSQSDVNTMEECQYAMLKQLLENKKEILNIYNSMSRELLEQYTMKLCEFAAEKYCAANDETEDKYLQIVFVKCQLFGQFIQWMNLKMPTEMLEWNHSLCEMLQRGAKIPVLKENTENLSGSKR